MRFEGLVASGKISGIGNLCYLDIVGVYILELPTGRYALYFCTITMSTHQTGGTPSHGSV